MKKNVIEPVQNILAYIYMVAAGLLFVLALGYMTNFHRLFYDGTSEMYDFFKNLQVYNKIFFNSAIVLVILAVLIKFFIVNRPTHILRSLLSIVIAVLTFIFTFNLFNAIPYYAYDYLSLDFSELEGYKVSLFVFNANRILFIVIVSASILLAIVTVIRLIRTVSIQRRSHA